ncbi:MAG: 3-oxoacyl-ACP reductase FabG [Betaproteobacteria bacterium]
MKTALVSGGSGEIGAAICRTLAGSGWQVVIHAHSHVERAEKLSAEICGAGGKAKWTRFDITNRDATAEALATLLEDGPIQGVVHNAGIHDDAPLAGMSAKQWDSVIDVSLHGFFNLTRPLLLPMMRTRWGRIVSVSSVAGVLGNRGQANYAAAKAGLHGATRSLALEVASRGITANVVAPGIVATRMSAAAFSAERIREMVPMQRAGTPQEVADLIAFLMSEQAGYVTGQVISINGGMA